MGKKFSPIKSEFLYELHHVAYAVIGNLYMRNYLWIHASGKALNVQTVYFSPQTSIRPRNFPLSIHSFYMSCTVWRVLLRKIAIQTVCHSGKCHSKWKIQMSLGLHLVIVFLSEAMIELVWKLLGEHQVRRARSAQVWLKKLIRSYHLYTYVCDW